jgi:putative DNA methylase
MLTWGALNIIGASPEKRAEIERAQREVAEAVDREITALGIEHDSQGNRAKAYLYCLETRCPETGWMVPMVPSWVISKTSNVAAKLVPDHPRKRFKIEIVTGVSAAEMKAAEQGTVRDWNLVYELDGKTYVTPIKTLRGDYRDTEGDVANDLRRWEKGDFKPRPDDIFQERLYCIQWITRESLNQTRKETFFASVTVEDLERERRVEAMVAENLARWQEEGVVPDMPIEVGGPPRYQRRDLVIARGWTYWNHLFGPRHLFLFAVIHSKQREKGYLPYFLGISSALNRSCRLSRWDSADRAREGVKDVFNNQALNTLFNYGARASSFKVFTISCNLSILLRFLEGSA